MNIRKLCISLILLLSSYDAYALYGRLQYVVPLSATAESLETAYYFSGIQDYVAGGTVFTYTSGIFTLTPIVRVAVVLKNATYSSGEVYVPVIVTNDTSSATIRVNKVSNGGTVIEAATDDVTLHLLAVGI